MRVSYVIPNWNGRDMLLKCVASIERQEGVDEKEIIVIDNASKDGSREALRAACPGAVLKSNSVNEGYAKATNKGVALCTSELIFLLNNDVVLYPETTYKLIGCLGEDPKAGAAAPLLYYPDGRFQISCRRFPSPLALVLEKLGLPRIGPFRKWKWTEKEHFTRNIVEQPMASALLLKRGTWDSVGSLDEGFPIFFNDVDWCYRLYRKTHYTIRLCREARAVHHEGASVNRMGIIKKVVFIRGLIRFYLKNYLRII